MLWNLGMIMYSRAYLDGEGYIACLGVQPHHLLSDEILFKLMANNKAAASRGWCLHKCLLFPW